MNLEIRIKSKLKSNRNISRNKDKVQKIVRIDRVYIW